MEFTDVPVPKFNFICVWCDTRSSIAVTITNVLLCQLHSQFDESITRRNVLFNEIYKWRWFFCSRFLSLTTLLVSSTVSSDSPYCFCCLESFFLFRVHFPMNCSTLAWLRIRTTHIWLNTIYKTNAINRMSQLKLCNMDSLYPARWERRVSEWCTHTHTHTLHGSGEATKLCVKARVYFVCVWNMVMRHASCLSSSTHCMNVNWI